MESYFNLKCKGNPLNRKAHKIYFCCNASDFNSLFDVISDEIIGIDQNINIYYYDPSEGMPSKEDIDVLLSEMQLFVIPITVGFLDERKPSFARVNEFSYALENHIPVIPLMQKPDVFPDEMAETKKQMIEAFNRCCGAIEYLDKDDDRKNPGLSYREKLERTLKSMLVDDELSQRIRDAFDAYVFLSYRKKDRAEAKKVMRLIHENEFCRDIAIWYDEYLVPGEEYNDAIEEAMKKSALFALVVTPSLLEDPNYVKDIEYPNANELDKIIVAIKTQEVDFPKLFETYEGIGEHIVDSDASQVSVRLRSLLKDIALRKNNDSSHNYFIGLAYLNGIDVEINKEKGAEIIRTAAEDGLPEAMEKLADIYSGGHGVARNHPEALKWQQKYVDWIKANDSSEDHYKTLYTGLTKIKKLMSVYSDIGPISREILECAEKMREEDCEGWLEYLRDAYYAMTEYYANSGDREKAKEYSEKYLNLYEKDRETGDAELLHAYRSLTRINWGVDKNWEIELTKATIKLMEDNSLEFNESYGYREYLNECRSCYHELSREGLVSEAKAMSDKIEKYGSDVIAACETSEDYQSAVKLCDDIAHMYSYIGPNNPDTPFDRLPWDDDYKSMIWFGKAYDICTMLAEQDDSFHWAYKAFCYYHGMYSRDRDADVFKELNYCKKMLEMIENMESRAASQEDYQELDSAYSIMSGLPDYLSMDEIEWNLRRLKLKSNFYEEYENYKEIIKAYKDVLVFPINSVLSDMGDYIERIKDLYLIDDDYSVRLFIYMSEKYRECGDIDASKKWLDYAISRAANTTLEDEDAIPLFSYMSRTLKEQGDNDTSKIILDYAIARAAATTGYAMFTAKTPFDNGGIFEDLFGLGKLCFEIAPDEEKIVFRKMVEMYEKLETEKRIGQEEQEYDEENIADVCRLIADYCKSTGRHEEEYFRRKAVEVYSGLWNRVNAYRVKTYLEDVLLSTLNLVECLIRNAKKDEAKKEMKAMEGLLKDAWDVWEKRIDKSLYEYYQREYDRVKKMIMDSNN